MTLAEIPDGDSVFLDANIFIYHFTGASRECAELLTRCERNALRGCTGTLTLAEVCHRLMMAEAIAKGRLTPKNAVRKLKKNPKLVQSLTQYPAHVAAIQGWGLRIVALPDDALLVSQTYRTRHGLMTNDSLIPVLMREAGTTNLATLDSAFRRVPGIHVYSPSDLAA